MPPTASTYELVAWFAKRYPGACRLAESVSLAVHIRPELLRRARVELNRGEGAGAEADLWFSPLIESASPRGFILRPEVAEVLREQLNKNPQRLEEAWQLLEQFHPFAPPVVVLEETVTWLALKLEWMTEEKAKEEVSGELNRQLSRVLHTLHTNAEREFSLARWAHHALPRLPRQARESEVGRALAIEALIRVGGSRTPSRDELPDRFPRSPSWVLPEGTGRTRLRLYRERDGLVFLDPEGDVPGHDLEVPATSPVVLELAWGEGGEEQGRLTFPEPGLREPVPEPVEVIRLRALDGRQWSFVTQSEKARRTPARKKPAGPPPVFLSYARSSSSQTQADALRLALGEGVVFQEVDIEAGAHMPTALVDALLGSRVFVAFVDENYFQLWPCLPEFEAALAPFTLGAGAPDAMREALSHVVLALPPSRSMPLAMLPPLLRGTDWPLAQDTRALEALVRARLDANPTRLGERLAARGQREKPRARLLEQLSLPPPDVLVGSSLYPWALPPSLGPAFVGREDDLWRIHHALSVQAASGGTPAVSVQGVGGIGKTRLALEYVYRFGPRYFPGGIFWVNADVGEDRLEEQLHGILRTLKPAVPDLMAFRKAGRNVAAELSRAFEDPSAEDPSAEDPSAREPVLYVVDDVPEPGPDGTPKPLRSWCPAMGRVSLLVTSRWPVDFGEEPHGRVLPLAPLTPDAAVALLTEGLGERERGGVRDSDWRQLAEWVGSFPLALELLNRSMRAGLEPESLLARAREPLPEGERPMKVLGHPVPPGLPRGVTEALSIAYDRLSEAEQVAARLISWLAPEPIPWELLVAIGPDVSSEEVYGTLLSRHFIIPVERASGRRSGSMPRLLADSLRGQSPEPREELRRVCQGLLEVMEPSASQESSAWPLMEACRPHAESVFTRLLKQDAASGVNAMISLGLSLGFFLSARGLPMQARSIEERVVERAAATLGMEHPGTLMAMTNLALTLFAQGALGEARMNLERVLEASRRVLGEDHPNTRSAMNSLAMVLLSLGELSAARALSEQAMRSSRTLLGTEHPETLRVMDNLARVLQAQGELASARALEQQVVEARRRLLGELHPETLTAMNNLTRLLSMMGEHPEAQALQERALRLSTRVLGEEHPDTLTAMSNLAMTLYARGHLEGARELEERVLEVRRRVLGEEHPDTLTAMSYLAATLHALEDLEGTRELEERVLEARRRVLGEEHPDTITAMSYLAATRYALDQFEGARELEERVLEVRRRVLGEEHPDTLTTMSGLAATLCVQRRPEEARKLEERVLEVRRRVLGEEHPDTLTAMSNLAATRYALDQFEGARELKRVLEVRQRALGDEHPDTLTAMSNLAEILLQDGHTAEAQRLLERMLESSHRTQGEQHPLTRQARKLLDQLAGEKPRS